MKTIIMLLVLIPLFLICMMLFALYIVLAMGIVNQQILNESKMRQLSLWQ